MSFKANELTMVRCLQPQWFREKGTTLLTEANSKGLAAPAAIGRAVLCIGVALTALLGAAPSTAATFTHRTVVTVDRTKIPGVANVVNFPVLVSVTNNALKTTGERRLRDEQPSVRHDLPGGGRADLLPGGSPLPPRPRD